VKVLVATRQPQKFLEIVEIFSGSPIRLVALPELGLEPTRAEEELEAFDSFSANALAKARHFRDRSGLPTLADDSGLRVDALGGAPGVRSKRFAPAEMQAEMGTDTANNRYLLRLLRQVPEPERTARFVCAAAVALPDVERVFLGQTEGRILTAPRGTGGFGYDPLFYVPDLGKTFAELSREEKNLVSHRGKAFRAARAWLEAWAAEHPTRT